MPAHKSTIVRELEAQSSQFMIAGFSFAAAFAWMEYMRYLTAVFLENVANIRSNSGMHILLTAVSTTLLAVCVFLVMRMFMDVRAVTFSPFPQKKVSNGAYY